MSRQSAERSRWAAAGVLVLGGLYALGARIDRAFRTRSRAVRGRPSCAVVSVGGLTLGGAGKTPTAVALARCLAATGRRVVIASRGYGGDSRDPVTVVSDGRTVRAHAERTGDESLVLAAHAPGIPVLVGRDRRVVGHRAVSGFDADILVLDDAFQHHGLDRDFDLVCIDGVAGLGNGCVVPAGPLREPASALRVADAVVLVDADAGTEALAKSLAERLADGTPILRGRRAATALEPHGGGEAISPAALAGRSVGLLAGIARPDSLRRSLEGLGAKVAEEKIFPDHHAYTEKDLAVLRDAVAESSVAEWVTTEKDAYKILPRWVEGVRLSVLRMEVEFDDPDALRDLVLAGLRARGRLAD